MRPLEVMKVENRHPDSSFGLNGHKDVCSSGPGGVNAW